MGTLWDMLARTTGDLPLWFKATGQCCPLHGDAAHPSTISGSLWTSLCWLGRMSPSPPMDAGELTFHAVSHPAGV